MTTVPIALTLARWVSSATALTAARPAFMFDRGLLPARPSNLGVVLPSEGLEHARARLAAGARQVLLADSLLKDVTLFGRAVKELSADRVGVWLPIRRMPVCWDLDTQSNGDFKCMVPTNPEATWEVLSSDGQATGTEVGAWVEQLVRQGATTVLVSVDMSDDRDLNLCAGLLERFGTRLWFSPRTAAPAHLREWIEYGQVRRLVLPDSAQTEAMADALLTRYESTQAAAALSA